MSSAKNYRQALLWLGRFIALAGVLFVVHQLSRYSDEISFETLNLAGWSLIFLLAILYGSSNIILALTWKELLKHLNTDISSSKAIKIYGISQIAKYLPGNIFHLAGRQALGMNAGTPAWTLVKSTAWELGLLAITGAVFSIIVLPLIFTQITILISCVLFTLVTILILFFTYIFFGINIVKSIVGYLFFLTIAGLVFYLVACVTSSSLVPAISLWIGSYVIAWFVGLVTPGAPAGVGVRELVLLFLLEGQAHSSELLLFVLISRAVTVMGDFLFFFISSLSARFDKVS